MSAPAQLRVALVGNPNSGKTTLFNGLTGLSARVGNYPGVTVEHREGSLTLDDGTRIDLVDLPGTYSAIPRADDEAVALRGIWGTLPGERAPDLVVAVVDAGALERNLYLAVQLLELGLPLVVALTMMDTLDRDGVQLDLARLSERLGVPVLRASAKAGDGAPLRAALPALLQARPPPPLPPAAEPAPHALQEHALDDVGALLFRQLHLPTPAHTLGLWALAARSAESHTRLGLAPHLEDAIARLPADPAYAQASIEARYRRVATLCEGVASHAQRQTRTRSQAITDRIDRVALHPLLGPLLLLVTFAALFQLLFAGSAPLMEAIEGWVGALGDAIAARWPDSLPLLRSLVVDGVVAGVGNVVVFVPQIAVLFLSLGLLENSGYLARAAFLLDRLMARVGLHGRAFVPLLSGFACAVPAILATRTIENTKDRFVTILVTPLVSCSARLPVYSLMIATVFSTQGPLWGVISPGVVVLLSMYLLGMAAAIGMAALFKRTLLKSPPPALVLELPLYRMPHVGDVLRHTASRVRIFLTEAGTVILALTVVLWGLFTFPRSEALAFERDARLSALEGNAPADADRESARAEVEAWFQQRSIEQSVAGRLGKAIEPVIEPLGFDWKVGVGLIASFAAREVLVSTLGLVYGLGSEGDEESVPLRDAMRADRDPKTGKARYTPLSGLSLMVFFVLAMQCMSTVAVVRREMRSWKWAAFLVVYMNALAYIGALLVYQGGVWLGFG